jgi:hypothetical protein
VLLRAAQSANLCADAELVEGAEGGGPDAQGGAGGRGGGLSLVDGDLPAVLMQGIAAERPPMPPPMIPAVFVMPATLLQM